MVTKEVVKCILAKRWELLKRLDLLRVCDAAGESCLARSFPGNLVPSYRSQEVIHPGVYR